MKTRNAIIGLTLETRVAVASREDTMRIGAGMTAAEKSTPAFRQKLKAVVFDWGLGLLLALALGGNAAAQTVCVPPPSGMISWWDGDAVSGTTAFDIIGEEDGTLVNGASTASGKVGQAFSSFSLNNYVRIPSSARLNPTGSFSVDAWIFPIADGFLHIVAKWGDTGTWSSQRAYSFHTLPNTGLRWAISDDAHQSDGPFHIFDTPSGVITLNAWNHVAATYNQSSGTRRIYVDGVQVADRTDPPITVTNSIADLAIGAQLNSPTTALAPFQGLVDEVELFNRALSANEIQAIFDAGSAGKCKVINVGIDIKPGSFPNSINLSSGGATPVAILGDGILDLMDIDLDTLTFGSNGIKTVGKKDRQLCSIEDVSGDFDSAFGLEGLPDGFDDLVCHFVTFNIVPEAGDTQVKISGDFKSGGSFEGFDSVNIVP